MATVFINGKMETNMKENGSLASNMDKVLTFSQIQILTLDNTSLVNLMVMVNTSGETAVSMLGTSKKV